MRNVHFVVFFSSKKAEYYTYSVNLAQLPLAQLYVIMVIRIKHNLNRAVAPVDDTEVMYFFWEFGVL